MRSRRIQHRVVGIAGIWALATLAPWSEAQPSARRPGKKPEVRADSLQGAFASDDVKSTIRALARSARPGAGLELALLSSSPAVTSDARVLIQAVRAMARFGHDPAVTRALLRHLRSPPSGEDLALRRTARSAAALSLARSATALGLRALVLLASGPDEGEPELALLARSALGAYPPTDEQLAAALPWLEPAERRQRLQVVDVQGSLDADRRKAACRAARRTLEEAPRWSTHAAARVTYDLARCPAGQEPDARAWSKLAKEDETWAFRGLAASGALLSDPGWIARAKAALRSDDPTVRSAAAWFLALTSSEMAERLTRDTHAEVRAAARNQRAANSSPGSSRSSCAFNDQSTSALFQRYTSSRGEADPPLLACLASRLRTTPGPGFTATELEALFAASAEPSRVSLAYGLRSVAAEAMPKAAGIAERLYASEGDAHVRRFLCSALQALDQGPRPDAWLDLELDADPVCRAIGRGLPADVARTATLSTATLSTATLSTVTSRPRFFAARVLSLPLELEPAPDGFVGARVTRQGHEDTLGREFVDCSESGEPTWACGERSQTPG